MGVSRSHTAVRALLIAAFVLAGGCAGMTESQCRGTNWYELGERDALIYGLRPQIEIYAHQCARYGVQPAEKEYLAGWFVGDRERAIRVTSDCCAP